MAEKKGKRKGKTSTKRETSIKRTDNTTEKLKKGKTISIRKSPVEVQFLSNIMDSHDIDKLINFLQITKQGKTNKILNLSSEFIENHEDGVEIFLKTAIKLEPKNPEHHYNYALFLEASRNYDNARSEFENAIELDNNNEHFRADFGNLLFLLEDYNGAEKQYRAAIGINPKNVHVWTNLGRLYFKSNNPNKAEKALKRAINIDPKFPLSYINLLQIYENSGNRSKAEELWERYKTINEEILDFKNLKISRRSRRKK
jgi:tetratricopeptide (TPR) repeat protein